MSYTGQANGTHFMLFEPNNHNFITPYLFDKYAKMNRYDCDWLASYVIFNLYACLINKESPL